MKVIGFIIITLLAIIGFNAQAFEVYGFIPYKAYIENGQLQQNRIPVEYFAKYGIKRINVVYEQHLLDYPQGDKSQAMINDDKIKQVAQDNLKQAAVPISLDLEGWNRFDTQNTPAQILQVVQKFKAYNNVAPVGLYATVPQNTYGWQADINERFDALNATYADVAASVDYFSPSLYNYHHQDNETWKQGAIYNIQASRRYSPNKKVIPYITPEIYNPDKSTSWLSYEEMLFRLNTLLELGADGCIIWTSSQTHDDQGNPPVFDPDNGWSKAIVDFSKNLQLH
ncbi:MAG: hypothetical protein WAX77_07465 [Methylococcaceae bacterium]